MVLIMAETILGILCIQLFLSRTDATSIIFLHHVATYSHVVSTINFANALVKKGHEVTYIAGFRPQYPHEPDPRIKFVISGQLNTFWEETALASFDVGNRVENRMPFLPMEMQNLGLITCELVLSSPEFQEWLKTNPKVDLVYGDLFYECAGGLAYRLKAKLGVFLTTPYWTKYNDILGIPDDSSSLESWTYTFSHGTGPLDSFFVRMANAVVTVFEYLISVHVHGDKYGDLFNIHLKSVPLLKGFEKNISLVLLSGNYISEFPRSLPPMVVSVPGMHVYEGSHKLPHDMEGFINPNNSQMNKGFVYVSLGTVAKASSLPENMKNTFLNSFASFPEIKFLWKWEGDHPVTVPRNVYLANWFPQQDVLGHPLIKAFITQTGRPSIQEALTKCVPMITIPLLGDQDINAKRMEALGVSVHVEVKGMTEETLKNALKKVIYDEDIRKQARKQAKLFTDLPIKPVDLAVWWTEYVIRHDDVSHLKPAGRNQTWYQRRQLDVWGFILAIIVVVVVLVWKSGVLVFKCFLSNSRINQSKIKTE